MTTTDGRVRDALARLQADSVYMLLYPGWAHEPRSNRWHFATRWARYLPVVLVCPESYWPRTLPERRIPNCRILRVAPNHDPGPVLCDATQVHTGHILADMRHVGVKRPILWSYNPWLAEAFAILPGIARVHHVTENYFDFNDLSPHFYERLRFMASIADISLAVSDGCAAPFAGIVPPERSLVATNGCDFAVYGAEIAPDPETIALRQEFRKLAIFAGNINFRLDFDLIGQIADATPETLLLFVGNLVRGDPQMSKFMRLLSRPNIKHLAAVSPDRLPAMYRAADLGFVPYIRERLLVENGFPLKVMEMAATGLPVVCSFMRPLAPHVPPLLMPEDTAGFVDAFCKTSRDSQSAAVLRALAAANDYDSRFAAIVEKLAAIPRREGARLDVLTTSFPAETATAIQNLLCNDRLALRLLIRHLMSHHRFVRIAHALRPAQLRETILTSILHMLDALPSPLRLRLRRAKRAMFGEPKGTR